MRAPRVNYVWHCCNSNSLDIAMQKCSSNPRCCSVIQLSFPNEITSSPFWEEERPISAVRTVITTSLGSIVDSTAYTAGVSAPNTHIYIYIYIYRCIKSALYILHLVSQNTDIKRCMRRCTHRCMHSLPIALNNAAVYCDV